MRMENYEYAPNFGALELWALPLDSVVSNLKYATDWVPLFFQSTEHRRVKMGSVVPPKDTYIYDDSECLQFARSLFWSLHEDLEILEIQDGESLDSFILKIVAYLSSSKSRSLKVMANSAEGVFYCKQMGENRWFFVSFVKINDENANPKTREPAITVYPGLMNLGDLLSGFISLSLFGADF